MYKSTTKEYCTWTQDDEDSSVYNTCNDTFEFNSYGVEGNGFKYCPFCGKEIDELMFMADIDEEISDD